MAATAIEREPVMIFIHTVERLAASADIHAFAIDGPLAGAAVDGDAFEFDGWIIGARQPVVAVIVRNECQHQSLTPVTRPRPDVAADYPRFPWARASGFHGWATVPGLTTGFRFQLVAEFADGSTEAFATIRGEIRESDEANADVSDWPGPDFIIIGAQRSGTTSLYRYLTQHPLIVAAEIKELKYFSFFHRRPWSWYSEQFPALAAGQITGEATPYYLFHPHAARRIRERLPHVKLIAMLRNPVDRAYSQYFHERDRGLEPLSFEEAIVQEPIRLAGETERMREDQAYASPAHQNHSYLSRGNYAVQLEHWLELFPPEQLLVLQSEAMYRDPNASVRSVTDFLELPSFNLGATPVHNERDYPAMAQATRQQLQDHFVGPNAHLAKLLGGSFDW